MVNTRQTAATLFAAVLLGAASSTEAAIMTQSESFAFSGSPIGIDILGFTEFDPVLGTLDSVTVDMDGILNFQVTILPGDTTTPQLGFDISPLTGKGFEFAGDGATLIFQPETNTGTGPAVYNFMTALTLDLSFNHTTDLFGFSFPVMTASTAAAIPPTWANGLLADFTEGIVPLGIMEQLIFQPKNFQPLTGISGSGSFLLTYNYTPYPNNIAEPTTIALSGLGLVCLGALRRRKNRETCEKKRLVDVSRPTLH